MGESQSDQTATQRHNRDANGRSSRPIWLGADSRGWDHVRVHAQVITDPELGPNEMAVYLGLTLHAELQTGRCFPAVATLAGYAAVHPATARRALQNLVRTGYVSVKSHAGKASEYFLLPPPPVFSDHDDGDLSPPLAEGEGVGIHTPRDSREDPTQDSRARSRGDRDEQEPLNEIHLTSEDPSQIGEGCGECDGTRRVIGDDNTARPCPKCSTKKNELPPPLNDRYVDHAMLASGERVEV